MAAGVYNITIEQGSTWTTDLIWKDNQLPPVPIDVTSYTARMQVRATLIDATVLTELTTENGRIIMGTTDGKITLTLSSTTTTAFAFVNGVYDLELISAGGVVTRLLKGTVTVDPEVTR